MTRECRLLDLGLIDYQSAWDMQRKLVVKRLEEGVSDILLLLEHPPVYTVGRRGTASGLHSLGLRVYEVERGGDVTYHGPGQLVGYPIIALPRGKLDVKAYVVRLEEVLRDVVRGYGLRGEDGPHAGLWVGGKKLASIGVAVKHHVTFHGFALNVNVDLAPFRSIRPCGLEATKITSLKELLAKEISMDDVKTRLIKSFSQRFGVTMTPGAQPQLGVLVPQMLHH